MTSGESVNLWESLDKAKTKLVNSLTDRSEITPVRVSEGKHDSVLTLKFNPRTRNEHMHMVAFGVFVTMDPFEETIIMIEIAEFRLSVGPDLIQMWDEITHLEKDSDEQFRRLEAFALEIIEQIFSEDEES